MAINIQYFKQRLLDKEQELSAAILRLESEARDSRVAEVGDSGDRALSSENKSEAFQESTVEWQMLTEVRDALRRIEDGTYGRCIDCGREIEPARLEAIPWTPYCLADQEIHDRQARVGRLP
ncbi:MAG: transcriptional regulator, TraR/DksA family [Bryobacterales bacterium]|nr:transcriptional regulator, TraR/DksA family [Bryobacterales bacterium]